MLRTMRAPARGVLVSQAARLANLTPRAVRFYEQQGLITSARGAGGQRVFDDTVLDRLIYIGEARRLGLSIREVQELLEIGETQGLDAQKARLREGCERRLCELEAQRCLVEATIKSLTRRSSPSRLRMAG